MKKSINIGSRLSPAILSACLIGLWEFSVRSGMVREHVLPAPSRILQDFIPSLPVMGVHIQATLIAAFTGFAVATVLSVILAVLMDLFPTVRKAVYPLLLMSQTVPLIALAPLFAIWFGLGILPKIVIVVLVCFFPIVVALYDGIASVDPDLLDLMRTMNAKPMQVYRHVKLPAAMTGFFSGMRIAATYSIMGAVIGEWMGGSAGLGIYMMRARSSFNLVHLFDAILVIVVLSLIIFYAIDRLQSALMPWSRRKEDK